MKSLFENLRKELNKTYDENGNIISDDRLDKVKQIESTIQKNLNETFRDIKIDLDIPPPEIKTILSTANIIADDGVRGPITNKGDGFKRAVTFSILRSYVELSHSIDWKKEKETKVKNRFLFLFEEPELYLHPKAQNILFEALSMISNEHQTLVSTHSPLFFSSNYTKSFLKIKKTDSEKPYSEVFPISLNEITDRDKFQIISFETGNHAFFSDKILLVEGDSEMILLPHIGKVLNENFDFKNNSISLVQARGKGSFKRYKDFFTQFNAKIYLVADLDIITNGFEKLEVEQSIVEVKNNLIQEIDKFLLNENSKENVEEKYLKEELQKDRSSRLYKKISDGRTEKDNEKVISALDEFFAFAKTKPRLEALKMPPEKTEIANLKYCLLKALRKEGIFIWEKGVIEDYYPDGVSKRKNKILAAQEFQQKVKTKDEVLALSSIEEDGKTEFEHIFESIFN